MKKTLTGILLSAGLLAGCGSSDSGSGVSQISSGTNEVAASSNGIVSSAQVENQVADVSPTSDSFTLSSVSEPSTSFRITTDNAGAFHIEETQDGQVVNPNFRVYGVCYSPAPINVLGDGSPNVGDFYFDTVVVNGINAFYNWYALFGSGSLSAGYVGRDDLTRIRKLGCNVIRTYSMISRQQVDGGNPFPADPSSGYHFSHKQFLDLCWNNGVNPIYVMVGIPMPSDNYIRRIYPDQPSNFYEFVINETVNDLKDHPAVLGFTISNEIDGGPDGAYPGTSGGVMAADNISTGVQNDDSDFYWGQVKKYSDLVKANAPGKLVGICFHNFREIAQYSSAFPTPADSYIQRCTNLDFVGINAYDTSNYNAQYQQGWGAVQGAGRKALIFTELGFPATTRTNPSDVTTITETADSRERTAALISKMLPQAYENSVSLGACYFEYCDEWWKQKDAGNRVDRWEGGASAPSFPNGYWDDEGFGLYSVKRGGNLQNNAPVVGSSGPLLPVDVQTERTEITEVVRNLYTSKP